MKIERLNIYTAKLEEQLKFYRDILELELLEQSSDFFELQIGFSVLRFQRMSQATPYHIAFHIPADQVEIAVDWLQQRTNILQDAGKDIVEFPNWNARSVYFYDAGKNIMEFISRRHCYAPTSAEFTSKSIVGISEIGLATELVAPVTDFLHRNFDLGKFTEFGTSFCATGDDEGLFIVIDKNQKDWFPTSDTAFASEFEIQFKTREGEFNLAYKNERLELL